jgi:hypothetical protein
VVQIIATKSLYGDAADGALFCLAPRQFFTKFASRKGYPAGQSIQQTKYIHDKVAADDVDKCDGQRGPAVLPHPAELALLASKSLFQPR